MKQLLFLLLFPCLCVAQYTGNAGQKITLGEQTTADGLVYRGVLADTGNITPFSDTSAYIILDTVNNRFFHYKRNTNVWSVAGGSDTSLIAYVNTYGTQTVNGAKTFTSAIVLNSGQINYIHSKKTNSGGNIFIGTLASGLKDTTPTYFSSYNTSVGNNALNALTVGYANTAIGYNTLSVTKNGEYNTAIGFTALQGLTTGVKNVSIGGNSLLNTTTGSNNFALGTNALYNNTIGNGNAGLGEQALYKNTTGIENVGLGFISLYENTTGQYNIGIGSQSGYASSGNANTTGSNNIFIGYNTVGTSATTSNVITLGNSSIATIRAQVTTITSLSDIRDKTDILPLNYGMNFINKLKPVSFVWDMRDGGKIGIPEIGFIAQDLQQAQIDSGINIPNLVSGVDEKLEASYGVLLPIIVKALQEANDKIKSLEQRIINLENK